MIISLTGFMGCGKSSVGKALSALLGCPFADLDAVIEARTGCTIPEYFARYGETAFRALEFQVLSELLDGGVSAVLALGGGTVMTPDCAHLVREQTCCIYLRATVDTLLERLRDEAAGRPLLQTPAFLPEDTSGETALRTRIESLLTRRAGTYEAVARHTLDVDGLSPGALAETIRTLTVSTN